MFSGLALLITTSADKQGDNSAESENKQSPVGKSTEKIQKDDKTVDDTSDDESGSEDDMSADKRGRWYGSVLGGGFSFGKRFSPRERFSSLKGQSNWLADGLEDGIINDIDTVEAGVPLNGKRWAPSDVYGIRYFPNRRSKREAADKRFIHYYGNMLGRGFSLGKRMDESAFGPEEEAEIMQDDDFEDFNDYDKRGYQGMLGRGFAFGKRHFFRGSPRNANFGSVLGRGFSFGKRDSPMDRSDEEDYSKSEMDESESDDVDGKDINEILHGKGEEEDIDKRYIYGSPGYRFGKRSGYEMDKRYGYLFGRPFSAGRKRFFNYQSKRPYGFVLGNGFSFGKRSGPEEWGNSFENDEEMPGDLLTEDDKRSILLGKGLMFGKRGMKRYGWLLGNGLKFGKRSSFEDSGKNSDEGDTFFVGENGAVYRINSDDVRDFETEDSDEEKYEFESPVKRSFGLVLGRGFSYGKRSPSWKRYGHILGGGFSFGK